MKNKPVVLVVDDEPQMVGVISYAFQIAGFEPLVAYDGRQAMEQVQNRHVDIVILDVMLPDTDGFELCKQIRRNTTIPILMLTARSDQLDVITGLESGADDYMAKPFSARELVLRTKAILRRASQNSRTFQSGPIQIDFLSHTVTVNDCLIGLSPLGYRLLVYLVRNTGRVINTQELLKEVWNLEASEGGPEMIKMEIYRLRQKIEPEPKQPYYIRTVRGSGYIFVLDEQS